FNFDVPTHSEDYIHRIGRTGRAGLKGTAITIASPIDRKYVGAIEKMIGEPINVLEVEASGERAASVYGHREQAEERPQRAEHGRERHRGRREGRGDHARNNGGAPRPEQQRTDVVEPVAMLAEPLAPVQTSGALPAPAEPQQRPNEQRHDRNHREPRRDQRPPREDQREPRRDHGHQRGDRNDHRREPADREPAAVGLGDHVPQFLLRRTRVPASET
ncbi:MAG: hypothetical protein ABI399_10420, partial [Bauldia sp.]